MVSKICLELGCGIQFARERSTDLNCIVAIAPHCPLGPIALAACLQVGLVTPNHIIQEMSQGIHYNKDAGEFDLHSYVSDPSIFDVEDGFVAAPKGPGLGIEINEDFVRKVASNATSWPLQGFIGKDGGIREW